MEVDDSKDTEISFDALPLYTFVLGYDGGESDSDEDIVDLETSQCHRPANKTKVSDMLLELAVKEPEPLQPEHTDLHPSVFAEEPPVAPIRDTSCNSPEGNIWTVLDQRCTLSKRCDETATSIHTEPRHISHDAVHKYGTQTLSKTKTLHIDIPSTVPHVSIGTFPSNDISQESRESLILETYDNSDTPIVQQCVNKMDSSPSNSPCTTSTTFEKECQSSPQVDTCFLPSQKRTLTDRTSISEIITEYERLVLPSSEGKCTRSVSSGIVESRCPSSKSTVTSPSLSGQKDISSSETIFERISRQFTLNCSTSCDNVNESRFSQQDGSDERQGLKTLTRSCVKVNRQRSTHGSNVYKERKNQMETAAVVSTNSHPPCSSKHHHELPRGSPQQRCKTLGEKESVHINLFDDFRALNDKAKIKQRTCKIIPTTNGDVIDFNAFSWPTQSQLCRSIICYERDGRLKGEATFSMPAKITLRASVPLYKTYSLTHFHTKDPRMTRLLAKFSDSNTDNTKQHFINKERYLSQGLFSRFLSSKGDLFPNDTCEQKLNLQKDKDRNSHSPSDPEQDDGSSISPSNRTLRISHDESRSVKKSSLRNSLTPSQREAGDTKADKRRRIKKRKKSRDKNSSNLKQKPPGKVVTPIPVVGKGSEEASVYQHGKRKCLDPPKPSNPRTKSLSTSCDIKTSHCQRKQLKMLRDMRTKDGLKIQQICNKLENGKGRKIYQRHCRKENRRNVLDYHLCSRCMIDKSVVLLTPPSLKVKSAACLKCSRKLRPKDLMCKFCNQCFPNLMTYCGHVYNLTTFHPSYKAFKNFVCCRCKQTFPTRFLFHEHLAYSKCTRFCFNCENMFPSRSSLEEHACVKKKKKKTCVSKRIEIK